jgi:hypothetical protein
MYFISIIEKYRVEFDVSTHDFDVIAGRAVEDFRIWKLLPSF